MAIAPDLPRALEPIPWVNANDFRDLTGTFERGGASRHQADRRASAVDRDPESLECHARRRFVAWW
jgi:hypothetical protein